MLILEGVNCLTFSMMEGLKKDPKKVKKGQKKAKTAKKGVKKGEKKINLLKSQTGVIPNES